MFLHETLIEGLIHVLADFGVERIFGIPGGGSSLDLMDGARRAGMEIVLTRTESAAALMAAVTGELTGSPGVAFAGIGPGAASAVNGVAYAFLERAPMVMFCDSRQPGVNASPHQVFDQLALYTPITKDRDRLEPDKGSARLSEMLTTSLQHPRGPVQVDLSARDSSSMSQSLGCKPGKETEEVAGDIEIARNLIVNTCRPIVIAGLESRYGKAPAALIRLVSALDCPVLTGYKAKGVFPEEDPHFVGQFTGALAERKLIGDADLIILYGFDPIEMIPGDCSFHLPVLMFRRSLRGDERSFNPSATITGPLEGGIETLLAFARTKDWHHEAFSEFRSDFIKRMSLCGRSVTSEMVVCAAVSVAPEETRLCVDAGAHMFSAMTHWIALRPHDVLKSNGLSTMGYALPAAIAGGLVEKGRQHLAITGDGGMMMCLGELSTAVHLGSNLVVVVVNDAALSLIDIKQQRQQRPSIGVRYLATDFAAAAEGLGCIGIRVTEAKDLNVVLTEAFTSPRPVLVDVICDPSGYADQLKALRG